MFVNGSFATKLDRPRHVRFPPERPNCGQLLEVRFVPISEVSEPLFDHPVRPREKDGREDRGPIAFAVFRLTISSNRLGRRIGRSPGLEPRKILSTEATAF